MSAPYPLPDSLGPLLARYRDRLLELDGEAEATEGSYYPALERLLRELAGEIGGGAVDVLTLPRRGAIGAPDLRVARGERLVGYVEAKRPGTDLEEVAASEQLGRYLAGCPNVLLTDGYEFWLYRDGERVDGARLAAHHGIHRACFPTSEARTGELLAAFLNHRPPPCASAASLARALARTTRLLAGTVAQLLAEDTPRVGTLRTLHRAFRRYLLPGLTAEAFADLYAQTVAYGLLAARHWSAAERFDRHTAFAAIPEHLGVLHGLFGSTLLEEPPRALLWIVDDLVALLAPVDLAALLARDAGRRRQDPILYFYETFLAAYAPRLRRRLGVYYTPPEVVSYMVRSVDRLLTEQLGRPLGLADPATTLLDPAAGTLTFLVEAVRRALARYRERYGEGASPEHLKAGLLERFFALERLIAPYTVGHLTMGVLLEELGSPLGRGERFGFFLTDAFETRPVRQVEVPGVRALSREAQEAQRIKERPVTVLLGNPPYSPGGRAPRRGDGEDLLREGWERPGGPRDDGYFRVEGAPLDETNPKWLRDDYVRFLRLAQRKVDEAGEGLVAFVTNHAYLDGPTFRGMRESLLQSFDRLYFLDLHGNRKKKERAPDGGRDENVFRIQPGVVIALLVKAPGLSRKVLRHDLWGRRGDKLAWLAAHDVTDTPFEPLEPRAPGYPFEHRDSSLEARWRRFPGVDEIFELGSVGVVTGRDRLVVALERRELEQRIGRFRLHDGALMAAQELGVGEAGQRRLEAAREALRRDELWSQRIRPYLFRPFDRRYLYDADVLVKRPRRRVMRHLDAPDNVALVVPKQGREGPAAFVTEVVCGHKAVSAYDINYAFPLYRRLDAGTDPGSAQLFEVSAGLVRPNLDRALLEDLAVRWGEQVTARAVFDYVYAVLHAPPYRHRYRELLVREFPRIPFPERYAGFEALAALGRQLVELHLLRDPGLEGARLRVRGTGDGRIGEPAELVYRPHAEELVLNRQGQRIGEIPQAVWTHRIGGYRVIESWLRCRRGRVLDVAELARIIAAVGETLRLEGEIERAYGKQVEEEGTEG